MDDAVAGRINTISLGCVVYAFIGEGCSCDILLNGDVLIGWSVY
jgi:hypothetical protein